MPGIKKVTRSKFSDRNATKERLDVQNSLGQSALRCDYTHMSIINNRTYGNCLCYKSILKATIHGATMHSSPIKLIMNRRCLNYKNHPKSRTHYPKCLRGGLLGGGGTGVTYKGTGRVCSETLARQHINIQNVTSCKTKRPDKAFAHFKAKGIGNSQPLITIFL
ncbi:hypothetical protein LguiA_029778 [Lonicera macranthoides]